MNRSSICATCLKDSFILRYIQFKGVFNSLFPNFKGGPIQVCWQCMEVIDKFRSLSHSAGCNEVVLTELRDPRDFESLPEVLPLDQFGEGTSSRFLTGNAAGKNRAPPALEVPVAKKQKTRVHSDNLVDENVDPPIVEDNIPTEAQSINDDDMDWDDGVVNLVDLNAGLSLPAKQQLDQSFSQEYQNEDDLIVLICDAEDADNEVDESDFIKRPATQKLINDFAEKRGMTQAAVEIAIEKTRMNTEQGKLIAKTLIRPLFPSVWKDIVELLPPAPGQPKNPKTLRRGKPGKWCTLKYCTIDKKTKKPIAHQFRELVSYLRHLIKHLTPYNYFDKRGKEFMRCCTVCKIMFDSRSNTAGALKHAHLNHVRCSKCKVTFVRNSDESKKHGGLEHQVGSPIIKFATFKKMADEANLLEKVDLLRKNG